MATNKKLRKLNEVEEGESSSSESSDGGDSDGERYDGDEVSVSLDLGRRRSQQTPILSQVIQIEFEGRNPDVSDFHGIRQLLQQLFLKSDINLSEMADIITGKFCSKWTV